MIYTRLAARATSRAIARQPRLAIPRRFASESAKVEASNSGSAFVREREAVKKHAAESSGGPLAGWKSMDSV